MKDKILVLIIGILIGAIMATTAFLIYNNTKSNNSNQLEMMQPNENGQMGEPPSKPDGDAGSQPPTRLEKFNNSNG